MSETDRNYDLQPDELPPIAAPELPYQPPTPRRYQPRIGLIGCGGISESHLSNYRDAGYNVVAISSRSQERANKRRADFFPDADVYTDWQKLLQRDDIDLVDVTTDPSPRGPIMEAALYAGKHVLSQKPFALDLKAGRRLVELAEAKSLKLAVNQNGRWAPHFSYIREAVADGIAGRIASVTQSVHWNHNWIHDTPFNQIPHVILFDFAVHWFDFVASVMPNQTPRRVTANMGKSPSQQSDPPLMAHVLIEYDEAIATLVFDADTRYGAEDRTVVRGSDATLISTGPSLSEQQVTGYTASGRFQPDLQGTWFKQGFQGTMAELICAIEEDREPRNSARDNLRSLEMCFAAVHSAETGQPVDPGAVTGLPEGAAGPH